MEVFCPGVSLGLWEEVQRWCLGAEKGWIRSGIAWKKWPITWRNFSYVNHKKLSYPHLFTCTLGRDEESNINDDDQDGTNNVTIEMKTRNNNSVISKVNINVTNLNATKKGSKKKNKKKKQQIDS